jgi:hypothetical protein
VSVECTTVKDQTSRQQTKPDKWDTSQPGWFTLAEVLRMRDADRENRKPKKGRPK